jgi:hypothetical protein
MEKQVLKLDYIKLTPELISAINSIQTGGTDHFSEPPTDDMFTNEPLNDTLQDLTELNDFMVYVYSNDPKLFREKKLENFLIKIHDMKDFFKSLAAP